MPDSPDALTKDWYRQHAHGVSPYRKDGKPVKRNQFPGVCYFCGIPIAAGEGALGKSGDTWVIYCIRTFEPVDALSRYRPDGTRIR